jgi:AcrR family transcriptional regulator
MAKTGRRPGPTQTREQIVLVARDQFAERGYAQTTIRSIAEAAGVHPALLHHYFGTKEALYRDALDLPVDPGEVLGRLLEETPPGAFAEAFARHAITTWRDPDSGAAMRATTRRYLTDPDSTALIRSHWETLAIPRIATALGIHESAAAAGVACLIGITFADSLLGITQLHQLSTDELVALATPVLEAYFQLPT